MLTPNCCYFGGTLVHFVLLKRTAYCRIKHILEALSKQHGRREWLARASALWDRFEEWTLEVVSGWNAYHPKPAGQDPEDPVSLRLSEALGYLLILLWVKLQTEETEMYTQKAKPSCRGHGLSTLLLRGTCPGGSCSVPNTAPP